MIWEIKGNRIFGASAEVDVDTRHGPRRLLVHLRIDGRGERWRVDRDTLFGLGWEAIDGGPGFASQDEAEGFAIAWVAAAEAQRTTTPRLDGDRCARCGERDDLEGGLCAGCAAAVADGASP